MKLFLAGYVMSVMVHNFVLIIRLRLLIFLLLQACTVTTRVQPLLRGALASECDGGIATAASNAGTMPDSYDQR